MSSIIKAMIMASNSSKTPVEGLDFYLPFDSDFKDAINNITPTNTAGDVFSIGTDAGANIEHYLKGTKSIGSTTCLQYDNSAGISNYGTNDFSVSFWLRAPSWNGYRNQIILSKKNGDENNGFVIYRDGTYNKINMRIGSYNNSKWQLMTSDPATNPNWVFWCFVKNNGVGTWYKNTITDTTGNFTGSATSDDIFRIGCSLTWGSTCCAYFDLKALRVYNRALLAKEIEMLYNEFTI